MNGAPQTIDELNNLPVKTEGGATLYMRDVAHIRDGFSPQTNIVRVNGRRGVLMSVYKTGNASTLDIVSRVKDTIERAKASLPPEINITSFFDQALFVRAAVQGVLHEALIAACLTAAMILLFLGDWRSTVIIAVSIPLSIMTSVIILSALGETINIMTLGGLALAVGILVDDATVAIENIDRNLSMGKSVRDAILDGSQEIAVPALVSTLCICIVFVPMFFLAGVARYLFVPLAEAVVFAMLASYLLSRTLVPTMALYLLKAENAPGVDHSWQRGLFHRYQAAFERGFERLRAGYRNALGVVLDRPTTSALVVVGFCAASMAPRAAPRPRLLPRGRRRPDSAAPPRADRAAHRGDGPPRRPGGRRYPRRRARRRPRDDSRQHRRAQQRPQSELQHLRRDRHERRRDPRAVE